MTFPSNEEVAGERWTLWLDADGILRANVITPTWGGGGVVVVREQDDCDVIPAGPVSAEMVEAALDAWYEPLPSEMPIEQREREAMRAALEAVFALSEAERDGGQG